MVTIAGLGAVGGHAVEGLARAGVGRLRIVDFDHIRKHNINRQIVALESTVGMLKAEAVRNRVAEINPHCRVEAMDTFVDLHSLPKLLEPRPDLLIDAIDSLGPKIDLLTVASRQNIPVISSMGAALRTDPAMIRTGDIFTTKKCPLARRIRKKLRQRSIKNGITCVYSIEDVNFEYQEPETDDADIVNPHHDRGRPRRTLGSLPTLTGIFGLTIANMAIQQLTRENGG
jgi:tRNA A37 threonylcarbamoyladenosine dehydratase